MGRYIFKRILRGLLSAVLVTAVVMVLIYSFMDRNLIFAEDPNYTRIKSNAKEVYKMQQWERYGYVDYVPYTDYLTTLQLDPERYIQAAKFADRASQDTPTAAQYIRQFTQNYTQKGYTVVRLEGKTRGRGYQEGGEPRLFAYKDVPLIRRLLSYFSGLITVDHTGKAEEVTGKRGLTFTLYDPAYGGKTFCPAIMGNGTIHKYLLYFDGSFPYLHQNFITLNLGQSYSVNQGVDVARTMTQSQGSFLQTEVTYPTGLTERSADDLHTAVYARDSLENGTAVIKARFTDDYTVLSTRRSGFSKLGYSFVIGIIAVALSYLIAIPLGIFMARHKDSIADKLGTAYIVFIAAVPSLAYIFLFKAIGGALGMPTTFDMENPHWLMYVLPVVSLALPAVANLSKWLRRYMLDQLSADYVKFARAGGLSEGQIFREHVLKNAIIPMLHGIPGSILGALVGAIITERVYVVPGAGNLLTQAVNAYDNGVIVGVTLFYAVLSVSSVILGDLLLSSVDPRISFSVKGR